MTTLFQHGAITQIRTNAANVYAFKVAGPINNTAAEALDRFMSDAMNSSGNTDVLLEMNVLLELNVLLDMTAYTEGDWDTLLGADIIESQFRALDHAARYAIIGTSGSASQIISVMDGYISAEGMAFDDGESTAAWAFVGAAPAV